MEVTPNQVYNYLASYFSRFNLNFHLESEIGFHLKNAVHLPPSSLFKKPCLHLSGHCLRPATLLKKRTVF